MVGGEETVGHVYSDALLSFGGKAVYQQREINVAALGAVVFGFITQGSDLVFEDELGFVEHAADQGAFTVVY